MHTQRRILQIVSATSLLVVGTAVALVASLGVMTGSVVVSITVAVVATLYRFAIAPWHRCWGANEDEVHAVMPGDEIIVDAGVTTRAIDIDAAPSDIWPWLAQLGYGRAGWYSYDWIDNDGVSSADRILPIYQQLEPGDQILMMPGLGPVVRRLEEEALLLAGDATGGTWCIQLCPRAGSTRLISRWRMPAPTTLAARLWVTLADPGAFIMERKMLLNLKDRAERHRDATAGGRRLRGCSTASHSG